MIPARAGGAFTSVVEFNDAEKFAQTQLPVAIGIRAVMTRHFRHASSPTFGGTRESID